MISIKVNPTDQKSFVLDDRGRKISYKKAGNVVNKTIHIVRRLKEGSLTLVTDTINRKADDVTTK